jgi:hypothetical protein
LGLCRVRGIAFSASCSAADVGAIRDKYVPTDVEIFEGSTAPSGARAISAGQAMIFV